MTVTVATRLSKIALTAASPWPATLIVAVLVDVGDLVLAADELGQPRHVVDAAVGVRGQDDDLQRVLRLQDGVLAAGPRCDPASASLADGAGGPAGDPVEEHVVLPRALVDPRPAAVGHGPACA